MITVGIPTYNRADTLAVTLHGVAALRCATGPREVRVVDNNSTDHAAKVQRRVEWRTGMCYVGV